MSTNSGSNHSGSRPRFPGRGTLEATRRESGQHARRAIALATLTLVASLIAVVPARAHDDNDQGEHRGWDRWHHREVVVVPRPAPIYIVPEPYYAPPPRVIYAPPLVVYPPPAVYSEPAISVILPIHLH